MNAAPAHLEAKLRFWEFTIGQIAAAFAVALAMRNLGNPTPSLAKSGYLTGGRLANWNFVYNFGGFFCGLGLIGSLGLYVERIRKRSPPVWGLGAHDEGRERVLRRPFCAKFG